MMKTNYLVKLVERKTILDQGQRSKDSNLSKLPTDVINLITEFSLDAKHPSNVQDQDIKTAIQYGEDKFSYKLFKKELDNLYVNLPKEITKNPEGQYLYNDKDISQLTNDEKLSLSNLLVKSKNSKHTESNDPDSVTAIEEIGCFNERERSYIEMINSEDKVSKKNQCCIIT